MIARRYLKPSEYNFVVGARSHNPEYQKEGEELENVKHHDNTLK